MNGRENPTAESARGITIVWAVLCAMTIASWWLSPAHPADAPTPNLAITVAVVGIGIIKSRLIIRYFMEVRTAPRWLRSTTDAWVVILWLGVLATYLCG